MLYFSRVVYRSLPQVLKALSVPEVIKFPQVQEVLRLASLNTLIEQGKDGNFAVIPSKIDQTCGASIRRNDQQPFIVIEGLDGSGKTTLTKFLQTKFNMELCATPPKLLLQIPDLRTFFDHQPEGIRRAFYSLGNYMAAHYVQSINRPVIMDRFWHSTAAYAFANQIKNGENANSLSDDDLQWPSDLFQPNLVLFLELSEKARLARHSDRKEFTNTPEEQALAADINFRENIKMCFKRISGVPLVSIDVDGSEEAAKHAVAKCILERFPTAFKTHEVKLTQIN